MLGIDGFKDDGGRECFRRNLTFSDGRKGDEMHNAYPAPTPCLQHLSAHALGSNGSLFSRSGTTCQGNSSMVRRPEAPASAHSRRRYARASRPASPGPYWAWGFGCSPAPSQRRTISAAAAMQPFAPIMQFHSEGSNPSPSVGAHPGTCRRVPRIPPCCRPSRVRRRADELIPYIYTEAKRSADTGTPMMRR